MLISGCFGKCVCLCSRNIVDICIGCTENVVLANVCVLKMFFWKMFVYWCSENVVLENVSVLEMLA